MKKLLFTLLLAAMVLPSWADDPTALYVVGNATTDNWTISNAEVLYKTSDRHYEGFVMFQNGTGSFKILCQQVDNTWHPFWGRTGGDAVTVDDRNEGFQLSYYENDGDGVFQSTFTGLYLVTVDLNTSDDPVKTETISFQEWGDEDIYSIGNAGQLQAFSDCVNRFKQDMDAELTANIDMSGKGWTPIGQNLKDYSGHFDGQGYRIRNLSTSSDYNNQALFGQAVGPAIIENVIIDSSCTIYGKRFAAGILGFVYGNNEAGVTVRNCGNEADVTGSGENNESVCAGIVACTNGGENASIVHIENCYNTGTISGPNNNAGICAWMGSTSSTMTNCYNIGSVYNGENICRKDDGTVCTNNFSYSSSAKEVTSGELCYKLNSGTTAWKQTIGTDDYPKLFGSTGVVKEVVEDESYTNLTIFDDASDDKVQIGSKADLIQFSKEVNAGNKALNAVLADNIDMSESNSHTPIGTDTYKYIGTFDGGGHSIKLVINRDAGYQGLFGRATRGAKFKNLIITGSVTGQYSSAALVGEVGADKENGTIEISNVGIEANVTISGDNVGAFVGNDWGWREVIIMDNCYNIGNITGGGTVSAIGNYFDTGSTLTNVYNKGAITYTNDTNSNMFTNYNRGTYSNCYTTTSGNGDVSGLTQGFDPDKIPTGELCYLLNGSTQGGTTWTQTLGISGTHPIPFNTQRLVYFNNPGYANMYVVDGVYQLSNAAELKDFAAKINDGTYLANTSANLTADIDMSENNSHTPIGTSTHRYCGTFDGKDHRVTLNINRPDDAYQGLFGYATRGATFQNLIIDGTIVCGESSAALVGKVGESGESGTITIKRVGCEAYVTGSGTNTKVGAFVGDNWGGVIVLNVENSYNTGDIKCSNYSTVMGFYTSGNSTFKNVYNIGTLTATTGTEPVYQFVIFNSGSGTYNNCYTQKSKSSTEVTGGELCAKLGYAFHQSAEDTWPNLNTTHDFVTKMSSVGYTTQYISESAVTIPSGVTAYAGEINDTWLRLVSIDGTIPKGEPVILKGTANTIYRFAPTTDVDRVTNALKGSDGTVTGDGSTIYALAKKGEPAEVGFYLVNNGLKIPEGRAYLEIVGDTPAPTPGEVKGFTFVFEDTEDGIKTLSNSPLKGENIYNLAGQRINKMQKGINIVNGKKIMK